MSLHGEIVSDDSNPLRVVHDDSGNEVRVLLLEGWYDWVKQLYDYYLDWITTFVGVERVPDYIEAYLDWLSMLTVEFGAYDVVFSATITGWILRLIKNRVSLGKFTYENRGFGIGGFGAGPFGGGFQILELPVEG